MIPMHLKERIYSKYGHRCVYCKVFLNSYDTSIRGKRHPDDQRTLDHVVPKKRGGKDVESNLVACCYKCNLEKSDRGWLEFAVQKNYETLKQREFYKSLWKE